MSCLAFSGRPAGQSPFRSTSVRRRRRGGLSPARGPRLAASLPGPRARARVLAPRARSAAAGLLRPGARTAPRRYALWARGPRIRSPLRGRAAPPPGALRPGARAVPRRSALGLWTGTASPLLPLATPNVRRARGPAGPAAPARRNPRCGDGRGTCPALPGLRQAGPSQRGERRGDVSPPLAFCSAMVVRLSKPIVTIPAARLG